MGKKGRRLTAARLNEILEEQRKESVRLVTRAKEHMKHRVEGTGSGAHKDKSKYSRKGFNVKDVEVTDE